MQKLYQKKAYKTKLFYYITIIDKYYKIKNIIYQYINPNRRVTADAAPIFQDMVFYPVQGGGRAVGLIPG